MAKFKIAVAEGDGIGPEVVAEGLKVLDEVGSRFGHEFEYEKVYIGGCAVDKFEDPLPDSEVEKILKCDALFFGAVGGPKWDNLPREKRPETGMLKIRKTLNAFANLRPAKVFDELVDASTLKPEVIKGIDILVVRELTGGIYFGQPKGIVEENGVKKGINTMIYTEPEIERIVRLAFELARQRRKKLTSVDKANVLDVSQLWRDVVEKVAKDYPDVEYNHLLVDNAAMQLVRDPKQFDVIVTGNIFGDILSDEASMLTGSIGMLPSASIGGEVGMFEPIHGSAPDIAGLGIANPIAQIESAAMMLKYGFKLDKEAEAIEKAVDMILKMGYRTPDIYSEGTRKVNTQQMGDLIAKAVGEVEI
ncbi:3-isopropylmalate dehydrogenase [Hippea alviniae]|uniref:3-isopropylmalate dehydrogenase n=1 Tax=Hippea alviniae TaxID=1279027 RepID=UPI0003B6448D|nr:3-isopropylmalate dehydrogenase [Hippea alviniae]